VKLPKIIVGIDPGTTSAVAAINLKGKLLALESRKNFGKNEIIKYISSIGSPTIIATDRELAPSLVMKISSGFNAVLFSPEEDLKHWEKQELTRSFDTKDSHQRDALAAALNAYRRNEEKIKKVEKAIEGLNLWKYVDEIKDMIIRERCSNISEAIDNVLSMERKPEDEKIKKEKEVTKGDIENILRKLRMSLKDKEKSLSILDNYARKLEERVEFLEGENERLKKNRMTPQKIDYKIKNIRSEMVKKREKMEEMNEIITALREMEKIRKQGLVPVKVVKNSSYEELKRLENMIGLHKDVLYFREYFRVDKKFMEKLKEREVEIVIGDFPENVKEKMEGEGIIVLGKKEIQVDISKNYGKISPESLKGVHKKSLIGWLKDYRKRLNE